jgi:proline iminopeptidase
MPKRQALPDARIRVFRNSAHMPFFEEPEAYFGELLPFLDAHRGAKTA